MKRRLFVLFLAAHTVALGHPVLVPAGRLVLVDGQVLKNAVIRSYDPTASKVLVVSEGKARLIPVDLLPPPVAERVKTQAAQAADLVQTTPIPAPGSTTAVQPESAPASPATAPAAPTTPPTPRIQVTTPEEPQDPAKAHRAAARAYLLRYYKYEHRIGSNAVTVTDADIEFESTEPVQGWTGRYRTTGKIFFAAYDSYGGGSFRRGSEKFEVLTEQKPGEEIKGIELTRK